MSAAAAAAAKSLQSCMTLCDPIDGSPPQGSRVPGILQARCLIMSKINEVTNFFNKGIIYPQKRYFHLHTHSQEYTHSQEH